MVKYRSAVHSPVVFNRNICPCSKAVVSAGTSERLSGRNYGKESKTGGKHWLWMVLTQPLDIKQHTRFYFLIENPYKEIKDSEKNTTLSLQRGPRKWKEEEEKVPLLHHNTSLTDIELYDSSKVSFPITSCSLLLELCSLHWADTDTGLGSDSEHPLWRMRKFFEEGALIEHLIPQAVFIWTVGAASQWEPGRGQISSTQWLLGRWSSCSVRWKNTQLTASWPQSHGRDPAALLDP